jgi:16S rRNA (uracil1498-N3)-methyltransferase
MSDRPLCRLYVEDALAPGGQAALSPGQAHYLRDVLRAPAGAAVALFNGRDGEFLARLAAGRGKGSAAQVERQLRPQASGPDVWLLFAPVKRAPIDSLVAKATELGAARLHPVLTRHTQVARVNVERLRANVIEAAEQCERLDLPEVAEPAPLDAVLKSWPTGRRLLVCDARSGAPPMAEVLAAARAEPRAPWAVLIGPEGGLAADELARLQALSAARLAHLGPRLLRADTAALAALTVWQAWLGDWSTAATRTM